MAETAIRDLRKKLFLSGSNREICMEDRLIKDGKFEYIEQGDGPVLLILHGLFGALSNFQDVMPELTKSFRVVIPMLPLYTLPVINSNVQNLAKFVKEFIEYKGWDKVHLLGNSLGGHIALIYTASHLDKVESIILTGSSGLYENSFGGSFPRRGSYEFVQKKVELTFYDPKVATKELVDECYEVVNDKGKALRIIGLARSAIKHNMAKELQYFNMPVCLIWGKNDAITPPEVAEEFHELLPNSELHWIDKCCHAPMMEHPRQFTDYVLGWYKEAFSIN